MIKGTCKWFNPAKGFGFLSPKEGGDDVFVHISAVERGGLATLTEGQDVEFELEKAPDGRMRASQVASL